MVHRISFSIFIFLLWISLLASQQCGTDSDDVTNVGKDVKALPSLTGNNSFNDLRNICYGSVKLTLQELQSAITEQEKCTQNAGDVLKRLTQACLIMGKLKTFNIKFEASLLSLKKSQNSMNKMTKFADILPAVGKTRRLLLEKVLPTALNALEYANIGVKKVSVYLERLLGFKKVKKVKNLLKEIDKKGSEACKKITPVGLMVERFRTTLKVSKFSSNVILQAMFETQSCFNTKCDLGGKHKCIDCASLNGEFASVFSLIKKWKESMESCHEILSSGSDALKKMAKVSKIFDHANTIMTEIDTFIKPLSESLEKSAKSLAPVTTNLFSCCPCGRPNPIGCLAESITKVIDLVTCPLGGLVNFPIKKLLLSFKTQIEELTETKFPNIEFNVVISAGQSFEISIPKFHQQCFGESSYKKNFTKFCGFPNSSIGISTPEIPSDKASSSSKAGTSLSKEIATSCKESVSYFKTFGKEMETCFDEVEDAFFLIPMVGAIAALTCDPEQSSDPDPGINYCPCKKPEVEHASEEQPSCIIWDSSKLKSCTTQCLEKKYAPGSNPSGLASTMHKSHGYPFCDELQYYCRKSNTNVRNGKIKCTSDYTFYGSKCEIIPDPGYICPIDFIECGTSSDPTKAVCWNYRFIECAKDDNKHFPICDCHNNNTFQEGELVCQYGNAHGIARSSILQMRKSVSCFKPLGLDEDIKKACGSSMRPCIIDKPNMEAYQRCNYTKKEKFIDAYAKNKKVFYACIGLFVGAVVFFIIGIIIAVKAHAKTGLCCLCFLFVLPLAIGLCMWFFIYVTDSPADDNTLYLQVSVVNGVN